MWSFHLEMRSCSRWYTHLGSLTRQSNGSFIIYVLGVSRHFHTTWWMRHETYVCLDLVGKRYERALCCLMHLMHVCTSCFFTRIGCSCRRYDQRTTIGAFCWRILLAHSVDAFSGFYLEDFRFSRPSGNYKFLIAAACQRARLIKGKIHRLICLLVCE